MSHSVFCTKLKKEAEGLSTPPYPGAIGKKIFDEISKEAWQMWIKHQTILINENRLNLTEAKSRQFLMDEMKKFLFDREIN